MLLGIMRTYQGYTLSSLLAEDAELFRLMRIEAMGREDEDDGE